MSMFTRRHYIWTASVLRQNACKTPHEPCDPCGHCEATRDFIEAFSGENDSFNEITFLKNIYGPFDANSTPKTL